MISLVFTIDLVQVVDVLEAIAGLNTEAVRSLPGDIQITPGPLLGGFVFDTRLLPVKVQAEHKVGKQVVFQANVVFPCIPSHVMAHDLTLVGIA